MRNLLLLLLLSSLSACGVWEGGDRPVNAVFCDNFLVYKMCARDMNRDGVVEFVYFEESEEVFMWREGARDTIPDDMVMHQCARVMDEDLVVTTSRVFYVDDDTPFLERTDIRGAMMIKYMAKLPEVAACNMRADQAREEANAP